MMVDQLLDDHRKVINESLRNIQDLFASIDDEADNFEAKVKSLNEADNMEIKRLEKELQWRDTEISQLKYKLNEFKTKEIEIQNEKAEILERLCNELNCSLCFEIFIEPMSLNCGHIYCDFCIKRWEDECTEDVEMKFVCPICRSSISDKNKNLYMENVVNIILHGSNEDAKRTRNELVKERMQKQMVLEDSDEWNTETSSSSLASSSSTRSISTADRIEAILRRTFSRLYPAASSLTSGSNSNPSTSSGTLRSNSITTMSTPGLGAISNSLSSSTAIMSSTPINGVKTGFLKFFAGKRGFGFIVQDDGGPDVFVHYSEIPSYDECGNSIDDHEGCWHDNPLWGQPVEYRVSRDSNGRYTAANVTGPNGASLVWASKSDNSENLSLNSGLALISLAMFD